MASGSSDGACSARRRCRRRSCEHCGPQRRRDEARKFGENIAAYGGRVVLVAVTAPGADVLPWDERRCSVEGPHKHRGDRGCRVAWDEGLRWNLDASERYARLWKAATVAADRLLRAYGWKGALPRRVAVVWSVQQRGVWHVHEALPAGSPAELLWSRTVIAYMSATGGRYGWGFVDRNPLRALGKGSSMLHGGRDAAEVAAYYLARNAASYLADNASTHSEMYVPGRRLRSYVSRRLTSITGVTMRSLRSCRYLWWLCSEGLPLPDHWDSDYIDLLGRLAGITPVLAQAP